MTFIGKIRRYIYIYVNLALFSYNKFYLDEESLANSMNKSSELTLSIVDWRFSDDAVVISYAYNTIRIEHSVLYTVLCIVRIET